MDNESRRWAVHFWLSILGIWESPKDLHSAELNTISPSSTCTNGCFAFSQSDPDSLPEASGLGQDEVNKWGSFWQFPRVVLVLADVWICTLQWLAASLNRRELSNTNQRFSSVKGEGYPPITPGGKIKFFWSKTLILTLFGPSFCERGGTPYVR